MPAMVDKRINSGTLSKYYIKNKQINLPFGSCDKGPKAHIARLLKSRSQMEFILNLDFKNIYF